MRLALKIAAQCYRGRHFPEDAASEAYFALVRAAQLFDPDRCVGEYEGQAPGHDPTAKVKFSTYAAYWVKASIYEFMVRSVGGGVVRVGTTRAQRKIVFGLGKAQRKLGDDATPEALAEEIGVGTSDVEDMLPRMRPRDTFIDNGYAKDGEARTAPLTLVDQGATPEATVADAEEARVNKKRVATLLRGLGERERIVVRSRFLAVNPKTLGQVGERLGVSRERVRQIELKAIGKMRAMQRPEEQ